MSSGVRGRVLVHPEEERWEARRRLMAHFRADRAYQYRVLQDLVPLLHKSGVAERLDEKLWREVWFLFVWVVTAWQRRELLGEGPTPKEVLQSWRELTGPRWTHYRPPGPSLEAIDLFGSVLIYLEGVSRTVSKRRILEEWPVTPAHTFVKPVDWAVAFVHADVRRKAGFHDHQDPTAFTWPVAGQITLMLQDDTLVVQRIGSRWHDESAIQESRHVLTSPPQEASWGDSRQHCLRVAHEAAIKEINSHFDALKAEYERETHQRNTSALHRRDDDIQILLRHLRQGNTIGRASSRRLDRLAGLLGIVLPGA